VCQYMADIFEFHSGRIRGALEEVMSRRPTSRHGDEACTGCLCCLTKEETIALRLYTGPMFMFYNRVLRELLKRDHARKCVEQALDHMFASGDADKDGTLDLKEFALLDSNKGLSEHEIRTTFDGLDVDKNGALDRKELRKIRGSQCAPTGWQESVVTEGDVEYRTTIHMISSGIMKLAEIMRRPENRKLYRGLSGMKMPLCFSQEDGLGWKGGVEVAFMSCTLKRDVALQYIGKGIMPIMVRNSQSCHTYE